MTNTRDNGTGAALDGATIELCVRVNGRNSREGYSDDDYRQAGAEWGTWSDELRQLVVSAGCLDAVEQLLSSDDAVEEWVTVAGDSDAAYDAAELAVRS